MDKVAKFITYILKVFIGIAAVAIFVNGIGYLSKLTLDDFSKRIVYLMLPSSILSIVIIFLKIDVKIKIFLLLTITLVLRLWWIFTVKSIPVSDFDTIYQTARNLLAGDRSELSDFGYLARFPHLVMTMLYMAGIIAIFPIHNIIVIKLINVIFSVLSIYLIYRLSKEFTNNEKIQLAALFFGAVFPPLISYTSVFCTENIAIPLYILAITAFIKLIDYRGKSLMKKALLCGVLLGFANLFRGVAIIFIVAFIFCIVLYKKKEKVRTGVFLIVGFMGVTILTSVVLILTGVVKTPLWMGTETSFTLLLKGSNIENGGRWNLEDADYVERHLSDDDLKKQCIDISLERFGSLSALSGMKFFGEKFVSQWRTGDSGGTYWAFLNINEGSSKSVSHPFELIYLIIIGFSCISLFSKTNEVKNSIIFVILGALGSLFIIIETQARYSYIISWIFIILAVQGIEVIVRLIERKVHGNVIKQLNS